MISLGKALLLQETTNIQTNEIYYNLKCSAVDALRIGVKTKPSLNYFLESITGINDVVFDCKHLTGLITVRFQNGWFN